MSNLKDALVKLGSTNPELRPHIRPLLKQAREMDLVSKIMDYEDGQMDDDEVIAFFQELIDTGVINSLQGSYQRQAQNLIRQGLVSAKGHHH